jgi:hypothetical protein
MKTPAITIYHKITNGFVAQKYALTEKGRYKCINQLFVAGGKTIYEDDNGYPVTIQQVLDKEELFPFEMMQPSDSPTHLQKLILALSIMTVKQKGLYKKKVKLLKKGIVITEVLQN